MQIRPALPSDMPALRQMASDFHAASCYVNSVPADLDSFASTVAHLADSPAGLVLVAEDAQGLAGMAAAMAMRHWFNARHITGQELFWWVEPRARGGGAGLKLMRGLEEWARARGCHSFCMASTSNLAPDKLARLYKRQGYEPQDIYYRKAL